MIRSFHARLLSFLVLAAGASVACAEGTDLGADESNVDSFTEPTAHGDLQFGVPNPAAFTDDGRFHAWTFTLPGAGKIGLSTELLTPNLDSVIYLYKKGASGRWGQSIASNDNFGGQMSSRIEEQLEAGEYMLEVKAKHPAMRGSFNVLGECLAGACPAPVGGDCSAPAAELPLAGHYGAACASVFAKIAAATPSPAPASCRAVEAAAVAYYKAYWDDLAGWEEMTGGEEIEPNVVVEHYAGVATVVNVDLGGDEDAMTYVFEPSGKLLYSYQHNQTPDWAWFCDGPAAEEPAEGCANLALDGHSTSPTSGSGTIAAGAAPASDTPAHVQTAIAEHVATAGVPAGQELGYSFRYWNEPYSAAAEVTVHAGDGAEATYLVTGDPSYQLTVVLRTDARGSAFVCKDVSR